MRRLGKDLSRLKGMYRMRALMECPFYRLADLEAMRKRGKVKPKKGTFLSL